MTDNEVDEVTALQTPCCCPAGEQKLYFLAADGSNESAVPLPKVGRSNMLAALLARCRVTQCCCCCACCRVHRMP